MNISRQLCGDNNSAYYYGDENENVVVAETEDLALSLAREASGNFSLQKSDLTREKDALDTVFSWLWPMRLMELEILIMMKLNITILQMIL